MFESTLNAPLLGLGILILWLLVFILFTSYSRRRERERKRKILDELARALWEEILGPVGERMTEIEGIEAPSEGNALKPQPLSETSVEEEEEMLKIQSLSEPPPRVQMLPEGEFKASEVSKIWGVSKTYAYKLLVKFVREGYLVRVSHGRYRKRSSSDDENPPLPERIQVLPQEFRTGEAQKLWGVTPPTAYRALKSFMEAGYLERISHGRYRKVC